ncbi:MAG: J domain-containing protein [Chlorobi bacterium]|nr:MAG: hypothetical protein UZ06_CHB003000207 [Chlorobi bacterium OLB6]MBE2265296.1 J domain-containing protein [Flavobacteriales bacterium]MBL1160241.1 J domain-containing protein [Chlorobiota bacterium]MBW7853379.1 J domain-containing protein [Candidatus Kapabacteria bacterium]MCC6330426.1 J domain-containing protein [Ignavibacteria bacterium]
MGQILNRIASLLQSEFGSQTPSPDYGFDNTVVPDADTELRRAIDEAVLHHKNTIPTEVHEALSVFGFSRLPTLAELQTEYRRQLKKWHPDVVKADRPAEKESAEHQVRTVIAAQLVILEYIKQTAIP